MPDTPSLHRHAEAWLKSGACDRIINEGGRRSPGAVCPRNDPKGYGPHAPVSRPTNDPKETVIEIPGLKATGHKTPGVFPKIFTGALFPECRPPACRHGQERAPTRCLPGQTGLPTYNYCPAKKAAHSSKTGRKSVATTSA